MTPTRRIRRTTAAAIALVCAVLAAACSTGGDGADDRAALTVMLDWTPNTNHSGIYLAQAKGLYERAGLDVTIVEPSDDGGLPQLAAGNVDIVISVAEQLLPARAAGVDAVSVAAILAHNTSSLVVPADRGVTRPRDLEGRTYGGFGGELEKALVDRLVRCDGGDPSRVRYVEVGNVDYRVGLERRDYDTVWVFDGWDVIRLAELEGMQLVRFPFYDPAAAPADRCLPDWYTPIVVTSQKVLDGRPDAIRAFLRATSVGYTVADDEPEAAADALLAAVPELDADLVRRSAAYLAGRYTDDAPWGVQRRATWTDFAAFLTGAGLLDPGVDASAAFTNDFLPGS